MDYMQRISVFTLGNFVEMMSEIKAQSGVEGWSKMFRTKEQQDQLEQVVVGSDTKESVAQKIGVPTVSGVLSDDSYYYVKMRKRALGFLAAKEIEREVVTVSFNVAGLVSNVERFGLERGQVVPLSRRVTTSSVADNTFLRQLLGNIGRFSPSSFGS